MKVVVVFWFVHPLQCCPILHLRQAFIQSAQDFATSQGLVRTHLQYNKPNKGFMIIEQDV